MNFKMVLRFVFIFAADFLANQSMAAEPTVLNFDELKADDIVGNRLGVYSSNTYLKRGVVLSSVLCRGVPSVGKEIVLRQTFAGFEVIGGHGQPAISRPNFVFSVGGAPNGCVLMKFNAPVSRVRLKTDCYADENPDVVRLYALKEEQERGRTHYSILAMSEGSDDATAEPDNQLEVHSVTPFTFAMFQCTTEREGFDDLEIVWASEDNLPAK